MGPGSKEGGADSTSEDALSHQHYASGTLLFEEGDPGGDLLFITAGRVQIFTREQGQEVTLTHMEKGEILGILTCLNNGPRLASARATEPVAVKVISHNNLKRLLSGTSGPLEIVFKEFSGRLQAMNRAYSEATSTIEQLSKRQIDDVFLGGQLAGTAAAVASYLAKDMGDGPVVEVQDLKDYLEAALNQDSALIDRLMETLTGSGLLSITIEPEKKRPVIACEKLANLQYFANFVKSLRVGNTKRLVEAGFSHKETRILSAMVKFALRLGVEPMKVCTISCQDLSSSLERSLGVAFDVAALARAADFKLIAIEGEGDKKSVSFRPAELGRTVACVEGVRRLRTRYSPDEEAKPKEKWQDLPNY